MANALEINIKGLDELSKRITSMQQRLVKDVDDVLNQNATAIELKAKQNATEVAFNEGKLAGSISADNSKLLEKHIVVNVVYAAFVEFGTGKYAAAYVSTLPENWQQFAATFRGQKGGGSFHDFVLIIAEWIKHKGIDVFAEREQSFDPESGNLIVHRKKRRTRDERAAKINQVAYLIARKIVTDGVRPRPFLFPAFRDQQDIIVKNIETLLNEL